MGSLGGVTFLGILIGYAVNWARIRRMYREHPEWGKDFLFNVNGAIALGVFLLLFEGNFGHNLFRYNWLWYGGFLIIIWHCLQERMKNLQFQISQQQNAQIGKLGVPPSPVQSLSGVGPAPPPGSPR